MAAYRRDYADEDELRQMYRDEGYEEDVAAGRLREREEYNVHLNPPPLDIEYCTHSQVHAYYDSIGRRLCSVHRYKKKDGTLAASGKPDPKEVLVGNTIYTLHGRE